ncbi:MAG: hypothetical protein U9R01_07480 [candidate division WOR-3 bacterium]|nr:hypothetical protein [candidate division WOR-3 bacterium]
MLISVMLAFVSCNKNDPVGGDFIDERMGDVVCDTLVHFVHNKFSGFLPTGSFDFLYAGNETNLKSMTLLSFERPLTKTTYDSVLFVFSAEGIGAEGLYLRQFSGEFWEDSVINWSYVDSHLGDILSHSPVWTEDTISDEVFCRFSLKEITLTDTINVAICSDGETNKFYSSNSGNPPVLELFRGPLLETVEPIKDVFVDTVVECDTAGIIFIASGSCVWKDTISLSDSLIDFTGISAINSAVLYLPINNFFGPDPELCVRYKDVPSIPYRIEGDTVEIEITEFIDEWITDENRFIVLEGKEGKLFTANIGKDIMLEVVYTKKPGERI